MFLPVLYFLHNLMVLGFQLECRYPSWMDSLAHKSSQTDFHCEDVGSCTLSFHPFQRWSGRSPQVLRPFLAYGLSQQSQEYSVEKAQVYQILVLVRFSDVAYSIAVLWHAVHHFSVQNLKLPTVRRCIPYQMIFPLLSDCTCRPQSQDLCF